MDERIKKLALASGLINYVDNETPRRYFIDGYADLSDVQKFAEMIALECANVCYNNDFNCGGEYAEKILLEFGIIRED